MSKIYSMTGFATGKMAFNGGELSCEIRSLNSRYLEIYVKLPTIFRELEDSVKEIIRKRINRGKVNCSITISSSEINLDNLSINETAVKAHYHLLEQIRQATGIEKPVELSDMLVFKEVLAFEENNSLDDDLKKAFFDFIDGLLQNLNKNRELEGDNLRTDLSERLQTLARLNAEITETGGGSAKAAFDKMRTRLLALIEEQKIDANRLELELALISDRVDVSEEVVRLESHIGMFDENLKAGSPIGKKLNFILQEMHREANTISSKSGNIGLSHLAVAAKEEIERIREQVQNIE